MLVVLSLGFCAPVPDARDALYTLWPTLPLAVIGTAPGSTGTTASAYAVLSSVLCAGRARGDQQAAQGAEPIFAPPLHSHTIAHRLPPRAFARARLAYARADAPWRAHAHVNCSERPPTADRQGPARLILSEETGESSHTLSSDHPTLPAAPARALRPLHSALPVAFASRALLKLSAVEADSRLVRVFSQELIVYTQLTPMQREQYKNILKRDMDAL
eukprot:6044432-Pleurochrysis_carterae.AAC.1